MPPKETPHTFNASTRLVAHIGATVLLTLAAIDLKISVGITIFTIAIFNLGMLQSFIVENEKIINKFNEENESKNHKTS